MRKSNKWRALEFIKKNGFYIALVICVMAAAAASYSAVTHMLDNIKQEAKPPQSNTEESGHDVSALPELPVEKDEPESETEEPAESIIEETAADPLVPIYSRPVDGVLVKPFSGDELVKSATLDDWRTHNGADYAAAVGQEVKAVYSGEITKALRDPLLGNVVEMKLDTGYVVRYAGLESVDGIIPGSRVSQGDVIGTVGKTSLLESAEEPHLHFELMSGDAYVDPEELFTPQA